MNGTLAAGAMEQALASVRLAEERLPFTVRVVRSEQALLKAVAIRQAAYARHMPAFAAKLMSPEPHDRDPGSLVLLAESKLDGSPLGSMRIQTNRFNELAIAQSVQLPAWLKNASMAEATRLGVCLGWTGRVVKTVLFKALYLYCMEAGVEWMVIGARPPLDRQYETLLFQDLIPGQFVPLRHANDIPHRVLGFEVGTADDRWADAKHPLYHFMVQTQHPDLDLSDADFSIHDTAPRREKLSTKAAIGA
jgi:hypothetical protein